MTTLATTPRRVGPLDMLWLTWQQHRIAIVSGGVLVAAFYAFTRVILPQEHINVATCSPHCGAVSVFGLAWLPMWVVLDAMGWLASAFGFLIAVYWAAPMIAREYEQRTDVLAWGQDVSVTAWVFGKIALLGVVAAGYAAVIGLAMSALVVPWGSIQPIVRANFESAVPVQMAYALFGIVLGVAVSAFVRRTVAAMAITAALFGIVRFVAYELRFTYLPPVRVEIPLVGSYTSFTMPRNLWQNLSDLGGPGHTILVLDYQPVGRLTAFRLIEIAIFVVLTAALAIAAWLRMRQRSVHR